MATLNEKPNGKADKGRSRKTTPRVDLTAMVDLMFLLTTFFMLTTSLATSNAADIAKPDDGGTVADYPASRTMTILLGKNSQAAYYLGLPNSAEMKVVPLNHLQKSIVETKKRVSQTHQGNPNKYMIIIIKPTGTAKFKDFVDVVDEMKIANIKSYAIDDSHFLDEEQDFLKEKGI
jgi:biopolymer transport protein ExbD